MLPENAIMEIENTTGYVFQNKHLLTQAFTRSSYHNEHRESQHNEVLEFYGDAVLKLAVTDILLEQYSYWQGGELYPVKREGDLSTLRDFLVSNPYLSLKTINLGLQKHLRCGNGDQFHSLDILADLFEALLGAIFLDSEKDIRIARDIVYRLLDVDAFLPIKSDNIS